MYIRIRFRFMVFKEAINKQAFRVFFKFSRFKFNKKIILGSTIFRFMVSRKSEKNKMLLTLRMKSRNWSVGISEKGRLDQCFIVVVVIQRSHLPHLGRIARVYTYSRYFIINSSCRYRLFQTIKWIYPRCIQTRWILTRMMMMKLNI